MRAIVDTSALYALLDRDDERHGDAAAAWERLLEQDADLCLTNYVLVEVLALVQRRLGMDAVRVLVQDLLPLFALHFVTPDAHAGALEALLTANRRGLSFVDCTTFACARAMGIQTAFAYDAHFDEQGLARA